MGLLNYISAFLYPPRCPACQKYVENTGDWCAECLNKTVNVHAVPLNIHDNSIFYRIWALGRYHGVLRDLIIRLKYGKKMAVLPSVHSFIKKSAHHINLPQDIDIVICVPLHKERLKQRGFNQTELIFKQWFTENSLKCENVLERVYFTKAQYNLTKKDRLKNLKNAFSLKKNSSVMNKNCLLVDDIYTTGVTMATCAEILKRHGAAKIYGLVLASDAE